MKSFILVLVIACHISLWATDYLIQEPVKVQTAQDGLVYYERSEAYRDAHPKFGYEKILPITRFQNPHVVKCFPDDLYQENSADASLMVLLYAPNWDKATKTPILLIHGAGDDAFRAWVHPRSLTTPDSIPLEKQGFMQKLVKKGYPVFAINFSHNHGCNYRQAEQIHNALQIIRKKTRREKVNIIAHSKGNCAASIYISGGEQVNPSYKNFLTPFANDIDTYVQLGAANKGIDIVFRYYTGNVYAIANETSSPVCFYEGLVYGFWQDLYIQDIYTQNPGQKNRGNYFPGQNQLLYNLVNDGLDFSPFSYTPVDFNMTMNACYNGGTTAFVSSYGIDYAIKEGGYTIARINQIGLDPRVSVVNIYGTHPIVQEIDLGFIKIPVGVTDYPSDGVLYKHSASYVDGIISRGARLIGQRGFDKNHLQIAYDDQVLNWIDSLWK